MGILKIALLGSPEVEHLDRRLFFHDRKALALLAYLSTEKGLHARQTLTRMLWPDSDMQHGRTALRITLLHLRHLLAELDTASPQHPHLLVTREALGLDLSSGVDLDLQVLDSTWKLARDLFPREGVQGEVRRSLISRLQHASALYRGGFLQNFTLRDTFDFDYWVGMQQGIWYQQIEQVFDWLSQLQRAEGALQQAIETVERWRSCDPLNEDIYLRLMQLHFAAGNRIAALKTYETCVEVLQKELYTRPSTQLTALAETLRGASFSLYSRHEAGTKPSNAPPLVGLPFVGRGVELSKLMALFERASAGQPQTVMLQGEAGIGKTRLATAFLDWAKAQGATPLEGKVLRTSQGLPYQPLQDMLRVRFEQEDALGHLLSAPWLAELARLMPDLRERYPDLSPPTEEQAFAAFRLFEALTRLTQALAARSPLLVFIDDMQWVDDATLDALAYLCKRWVEWNTPALLLLNLRQETRSMEPRLVEWLASLSDTISLTRLSPGELSARDTLQAVRSLTHPELIQPQADSESAPLRSASPRSESPANSLGQEQFGEWLYAETRGQPYYMKALLDQLIERGLLIPHLVEEKGWMFAPQAAILDGHLFDSELPPQIDELIQRRLARLSSPAWQLLAAGAVLRHDFTFDELHKVAQLAPQEGLAALDEAIEHLFLRESNRQPASASYQFCHPILRQAIYLEVSAARRQDLTGRAR